MTLSRSVGLKRTGFAKSERKEASAVKKIRAANKAADSTGLANENKAAKRTRKCEICREVFEKRSMTHKVCSGDCGAALVQRDRARKEARATKEAKESQKGIKGWLKSTERVINHYVLLRDRLEGCCSCPKGSHWDGTWHASHYKSVGSNSALRFNLWNINKGCSQCNLFQGGNATEYARRLEAKHGPERVEWLKNHDRSRDYTIEYLQRLTKIFNKKCLRIKRRMRGKKPAATGLAPVTNKTN